MTVSAMNATIEPAISIHTAAPGGSVLELVQRRLRESSYYYLRTIHCAVDEGVVTLRGRVPSYYLKQTVQSLAEKVEGVQQVINLVDVMYPARAS